MARGTGSSIVSKCALVLDVLSQARQPLSFAEIVAKTGFAKSSCHRILAVLQSEDMISYEKETRLYHTGPRLKRWARSTWHRTDLQDVSAGPMDRLCEETRMHTAISILDDEFILYLRATDYTPIRLAARAGDRAPVHNTAAGKVFLAHMSPKRRSDAFATLKLEKFTEFTKTQQTHLEAEFEDILRLGYAVSIKEEYLHVMGMAAPLRNTQGQVIASLSLWTLTDASSEDEFRSQAPRLLRCATEISALID